MDAEEAVNSASNPVSALEGAWSLEEWPVDVQRVDENGIDLERIDYNLSLTPAERLRNLEAYAEFIISTRRRNGVEAWSDIEKS